MINYYTLYKKDDLLDLQLSQNEVGLIKSFFLTNKFDPKLFNDNQKIHFKDKELLEIFNNKVFAGEMIISESEPSCNEFFFDIAIKINPNVDLLVVCFANSEIWSFFDVEIDNKYYKLTNFCKKIEKYYIQKIEYFPDLKIDSTNKLIYAVDHFKKTAMPKLAMFRFRSNLEK